MLITLTTLFVLAVGLSVDTFAAALAKGATIKRLKRPQKRKIAAIFTACAVVAPLLGWSLGSLVADYIGSFDHWVAFILLAGVGTNMVWNGVKIAEEDTSTNLSPTKILITAIATNVDAVAVGIGLAFVEINIGLVCLAVALGTLVAVYLGLHFGKRTGKLLGQRAEIIGGAVLILLGLKILLDHLLA